MLNTKTKLQQIQKKSEDALSIFQNTLKNLSETNKEARTARAKAMEKRLALQEEEAQYDIIISKNQVLSDKIESFLDI